MIEIINQLSRSKQYPSMDIRSNINNYNEEIIKEIEGRLRRLDPKLHNGSVTIYEDGDDSFRLTVESSERNTTERITQLLQPYIDRLNSLEG